MNRTIKTDIVIIGGGIAGLWMLNRLRQMGYSVILLESDTLGGGQTGKSQGIIHGGMKYALQGLLTPSAQAITDLPNLWKQCLSGEGEINLSQVPILSSQQYLWSTGSLVSKMAGMFAGFMLKNNITAVDKKNYPEIFQHEDFNGRVLALDEMVIDVYGVLKELAKPHANFIFKINPLQEQDFEIGDDHQVQGLTIHSGSHLSLQIKAKRYILAAGSGNEDLLKHLKINSIPMQRRPLHMVLMKHDFPHPLYAHCLGISSTPRITITTHRAHDGQWIWYLGGQLAEEGVHRSSENQISEAQAELGGLFPWLDFSKARYASFFIDRAENFQTDGSRPHTYYMKNVGNLYVTWPTKLVLAPLLTKNIIQHIVDAKVMPSYSDPLPDWPSPDIAIPIWDQLL